MESTIEIINKVWKDGSAIIDNPSALDDIALLKEGIVKTDLGNGKIAFTRLKKLEQAKKECGHKYQMPEFADDVIGLLRGAAEGKRSRNICLTGAAGTGKTEFVYEVASVAGFAKVFQINGHIDLKPRDFYGKMTVAVDNTTGQNYTTFEKGALYRAFIEGTEVDANGNQVLYDDNGNVTTSNNGKPKVIGKPGLFFLDEFAAVLPEVLLAVMNRAMEIPRNPGDCRSIEVTEDAGRIVKAHPGFAMVLAGNTVGTGNNGINQMGFTAQGNKMDESTLSRITDFVKFGYNKVAERAIAEKYLGDDEDVEKLMQLRDALRKLARQGDCQRVFSTRHLVQICDSAKCLRDSGNKDYMRKALKYAIFNGLDDDDKQGWNETIRMVYGWDFVAEEANASAQYDFF